jgi:hypothetical protein
MIIILKPIADIYKEHEAAKKREYEEQVLQTEKGSFIPVVLTTSRGMRPACKNMLKRLAQKISEKRGERYSDVINHLETRIRFVGGFDRHRRDTIMFCRSFQITSTPLSKILFAQRSAGCAYR